MSEESVLKSAAEAVKRGDEDAAVEVAQQAIREGLDLAKVISHGFTVGMNEIGERFANEDIFLPDVIVAADAMTKAMETLEPHLTEETKMEKQGVVVIGTIEGDIHDIGKRIVGTMLKVNGFEVHDLGRDVTVAEFVKKAEELNATIVGSSTLMTTTMVNQRLLEEALNKAGLRNRVKTMIGGAPVNQGWADRIGADAYGQDANDAVLKAKELSA